MEPLLCLLWSWRSSSGGGGGSAMSSMVPAVAGELGGSGLPAPPEPERPTDFRFSVRWRSSRKLGWPEPPLGEVVAGGGGST